MVVGVGAWLEYRALFPQPATADTSALEPVPKGVRIAATYEKGCNNAGPEPNYNVTFVTLDVDADTADAAEAEVSDHLRSRGFAVADAPSDDYRSWARKTGRGHEMTVWLGTADEFTQFANAHTIADESFAQDQSIDRLPPPTGQRVVLLLEPDNDGCIG